MRKIINPCKCDVGYKHEKLVNTFCKIEWRRKCRERIEKKKKNETKGTLPVGSVIEFKRFDDVIIRLQKMNPAYQFKRTWWYREENDTYYPTRRIPDNFTIISKGDV